MCVDVFGSHFDTDIIGFVADNVFSPESFSNMATWELVIRDGVIQSMLGDLFVWKNLSNEPEGPALPIWECTRCTITDVENARDASIMWKCIIDVSPEYSCLRLSRWDYTQEMGLAWEPIEEYIPNRMRQN